MCKYTRESSYDKIVVKISAIFSPFYTLFSSVMSRDLFSTSFLTIDSIGRTERSALKVLREQLFAHKSDLISAFKQFDTENTGVCRVAFSPAQQILWRLIHSSPVSPASSEDI